MMLFKISIKNVKKSINDYLIYFLTLVFAVAIFYIFNAIDSSSAMYSMSQQEVLKFAVSIFNYISIVACVVFAFLIVYAGNFIIKRRNKEFGIYLILGMSRKDVSKIIIIENLLIGFISLIIGLIIGVFGSQVMSVITSILFKADLNEFTFSYSFEALSKTIIYYVFMFILELIILIHKIKKLSLLELINSNKYNQEIINNNNLSIIIFVISIIFLGIAYYIIGGFPISVVLGDRKILILIIVLGCIGTFMLFYSISGFLINVIKKFKSIYYKNINLFTLKSINSSINTMIMTMSVICILLFLTICILSSSLSLSNYMNKELNETIKSDYYLAVIDGESPEKILLDNNVFIKNISSRYVDGTIKTFPHLLTYNTLNGIIGNYDETKYWDKDIISQEEMNDDQFVIDDDILLPLTIPQDVISNSDYNRLAEIYGFNQYTLADDEYFIFGNDDQSNKVREEALSRNDLLNIYGYQVHSKFKNIKNGFIELSNGKSCYGVLVISDQLMKSIDNNCISFTSYVVGDYKSQNETIQNKYNTQITNIMENNSGIQSNSISLYESSIGLGTTLTFIGIYLGLVFMITSAAILALKEVSGISDNILRYKVLNEIGCSRKMINKSIIHQIGVFYTLPLLLAIVHSVFGLFFIRKVLLIFGTNDIFQGLGSTLLLILLIYGLYFLITIFLAKRIINTNLNK